MDEDQKFENIVNRGMEEYFRRNPRIAIQFGREEYEKEIESGTGEHIEENLKWFGKWIEEIKLLDIEKLNFENRISLKAMEYYHKINIFMHDAFALWKKDPNGLAYFHETIFLLFQRKGPVNSVAEAIITHINRLPKYLEEFQSRFDDTPIPKIWRDLALETIETTPKILKNIAEAYDQTSEVSLSLKKKLLETFEVVESVIQSHIKWIKNLPVNTGDFAWALGSEKIDELLSIRKLPWDRDLILKKGKELFNSLLKRLKQIGREIAPNKTLTEAIEEFFKKDKIPTFQETLEYTQKEAERAKEFIINHNLATIPTEKLIFVETPPHLVKIIPSAAYFEPPYFNKEQPGIYLITNLQDEEITTGHSYIAISNAMVHEAYPGHHLDFVSNNEFVPPIRLLGVAWEIVEGWAHYCEEMMLKQGFHKDPKNAERLIVGTQLYRAIRVILDIQLHCKQRTVEDATKMLMNVLAMDEISAKAEVLRYTSSPTYQLSYLIGKLLIEDLRREVEDNMGSKFNLKFFHDTILRSGDLPYYLLKEYFNEKLKNV